MPFHKSNDNCDHCNSSGNWPAAVILEHFLCLAGCKTALSSIHPVSVDIQMTVIWRSCSKEDKLSLAPKGPAERSSLWRRTEVKLSCALRLITELASPSHKTESSLQAVVHSALKKKGHPTLENTMATPLNQMTCCRPNHFWAHLCWLEVYRDLNLCHQTVLGNTVMDLDFNSQRTA